MGKAVPLQQAKAESQEKNFRHSQQATQLTSDSMGFSDSRAQVIAQKRLQDTADNSAQTRQLQAFSQMAQTSARAMQLKALGAAINATGLQNTMAENERLLQVKFDVLQSEEGDDSLQAKSAEVNTFQIQHAEQNVPKANNTGLPDSLKSGIESLSGLSMDHVKVHYNSEQPAQLNAHAYAQGSDIHIAPGQERHLPHEAWHIVQQAQGRVKPTMQMKGNAQINDDMTLEREADVMGARAMTKVSDGVVQQTHWYGSPRSFVGNATGKMVPEISSRVILRATAAPLSTKLRLAGMNSHTQDTIVVQRQLMKGKFNLVGEKHRFGEYPAEKLYVKEVLGESAELRYENEFSVPDFPNKDDPEAQLPVDDRVLTIGYLYAATVESLKELASGRPAAKLFSWLQSDDATVLEFAERSLTGEFDHLKIIQSKTSELMSKLAHSQSHMDKLNNMHTCAGLLYSTIRELDGEPKQNLEKVEGVINTCYYDGDLSLSGSELAQSKKIHKERSQNMYSAALTKDAKEMVQSGIVWKVGDGHIDDLLLTKEHTEYMEEDIAITSRTEWLTGYNQFCIDNGHRRQIEEE